MDHDRIEREIFIEAPRQTVWELVSEPAWWVGDKPGPDSVQVDGTRIEAETRFGTFPVWIVQIDQPHYLACRWASSFHGEEPKEGNSTLVEFTLKEKDGGTLLTVVESGFSSLAVSDEKQRDFYKENTHGWKQQLEVIRKRTES
ncbi:MAG TPA: SRPBCC domain-containing protein [Bacillales bacterium]|nr:SRPBCC domain-containing protein [Bacillales bacterium]